MELVVNVSVCLLDLRDWQGPGKHHGSQKIKDYFYKLNWALETLVEICVCVCVWYLLIITVQFLCKSSTQYLAFSTGELIKVA